MRQIENLTDRWIEKNEQIEILYIMPYSVGMKYYAYPDYLGALPYATLEEEIAERKQTDTKFKTLFESSSDAVVLLNLNGFIDKIKSVFPESSTQICIFH